MAAKFVAPSAKRNSFNCPVCGALADQQWFDVYAARIGDRKTPRLIDEDSLERIREQIKNSPTYESEKFMLEHFEREATGLMFLGSADEDCKHRVFNIFISQCYSCEEITLWSYDTILFPPYSYEIDPNEDLPDDVKADFNEARQILDLSPRGAALLRLCIQKILNHLEVPGKTIDSQIAKLVEDGLSTKIRDALDVVRVIGNESVHPGSMDLRDDRATASKLFELVNMIAHDRITHPRELNELVQTLPEGKRAAIAKRDSRNKKNGNLTEVSDKTSD